MKKKKCKICGDLFPVFNSTQQVCSPKCALKYAKDKKKKNHDKLRKTQEPTRLKNKADKLYQIKYKAKYPMSIISDEPTQVIHHFIFKSHSNNLRYAEINAIPLTIKEHDVIHNRTGRSELELIITTKKGIDWQKEVLRESNIRCKLTPAYLKEIVKGLGNDNQ